MNLNPHEEIAVLSILRAIRAGEFDAEDFSDAAIKLAITEGCIEGYPFRLTERGEAELADADKPEDPRDRLEDV